MTNIAIKSKPTILEIYHQIEAIVPYDAIEQQHIDETLIWISSGVPIFRIQKPDIPDKHLVSYFVLFDEKNNKILLVDHIKAGLWLPAGGHVEIDENPTETVNRECIEELGITADFWAPTPIFLTSTLTVGLTAGHTDVSLWYVLKGDSNKAYHFDKDEFYSIRWFSFDAIPYKKSDPHMKRFIEKLKMKLKKLRKSI